MSLPVDIEYLDAESEEEVVDMANQIWSVLCASGGTDPAIPAAALGCVLALLMSQTGCPEAIFTAALTARDEQYRELVEMGDAVAITEH